VQQPTTAEEVQPAVAGVRPDRVVLLDDQRAQRAVRLFFGRDRRQADDGVSLGSQVQQQVPERGVVLGHVLEEVVGGADDLVSRHSAAGPSAHAVRDDREHGTRIARAGDDGHAVLLLLAVTDVLRYADVDFEARHAKMRPLEEVYHRAIRDLTSAGTAAFSGPL
jgi:hypothetical protein